MNATDFRIETFKAVGKMVLLLKEIEEELVHGNFMEFIENELLEYGDKEIPNEMFSEIIRYAAMKTASQGLSDKIKAAFKIVDETSN